MSDPMGLPGSLIQKYLDAGYTIEQISEFKVQDREVNGWHRVTITTPKTKTTWIQGPGGKYTRKD